MAVIKKKKKEEKIDERHAWYDIDRKILIKKKKKKIKMFHDIFWKMSPFPPPPPPLWNLDMLKLGWNSVHGCVIYYKKKNSRPRISFPVFVFFFFFFLFGFHEYQSEKKNDTREKYIL